MGFLYIRKYIQLRKKSIDEQHVMYAIDNTTPAVSQT